jgi:hypothetical protein
MEQKQLNEVDEYSHGRIEAEIPDTATERQTEVLVAAIRNPDLKISELAEASDLDPNHVVEVLRSLATGVLQEQARAAHEASNLRDGHKEAENFSELTRKQKAVVDYLARHPRIDWRTVSGADLNEGIREYEEGEAADAPAMSDSYVKRVAAQYAGLIERRRAWYREHNPAAISDEEVSVEANRPGKEDTPREYLGDRFELPSENLDVGEGEDAVEELTEDERLDQAFKKASQRLATVEVVEGELYLNGEHQDTHRVEPRSHIGDDDFYDGDVRIGEVYEGVVNGFASWGVWWTVGGTPDTPDDVSGISPEDELNAAGYTTDNFEVGDTHTLVCFGRVTGQDGRTRHRFVPEPEAVRKRRRERRRRGVSGEGEATDAESEDGREEGESDVYEPDNYDRGDAAETLDNLVGTVSTMVERVNELEDENLPERMEAVAAGLSEVEEDVRDAINTASGGAGKADEAIEKVEELREDVEELAEGVGRVGGQAHENEQAIERVEDAVRAAADADPDVDLQTAIQEIRDHGGEVRFNAVNSDEGGEDDE